MMMPKLSKVFNRGGYGAFKPVIPKADSALIREN